MNIWQIIPTLLSLGSIFVLIGILWVWIKLKGRSGKRNPLTRDLLRAPGESLREQIDDIWSDISAYLVVLPLMIVTAYATYISQIAFGSMPHKPAVAMAYVLIFLVFLIWVCFRFWRLLKKRQKLALGYEAELAVGQELNELMRNGYFVFHDLPAENFNIDHVVIGPNGVFAVETKGRAKSKVAGANNEGWKVSYDGKALQFPTWQETAPLEQAVRQAKWLREWLGSAVGESVAVHAVLVLPGWFVNRTGPGGIPVLTGKQIATYFPKLGGRDHLDDSMIQRIVHQVDQRCRDIEPRAYAEHKNQ